ERVPQPLGRLLELDADLLDAIAQVLLPLEEGLLLLFLQLRLAPLRRVDLALDLIGLALQALYAFDLLLDLVDHAALDVLGELDAPDVLRDEDALAQHAPAGTPPGGVLLLGLALLDRCRLGLGRLV